MTNFRGFAYLLFVLFCARTLSTFANDDRKEYIVYMGSKTDEYSISRVDHLNILQRVTSSSTPEESLIRSYGRSFNGFSAKLTDKESQRLKNTKGVVSVFPSRTLELQTTRSWDYLGVPEPTVQQQSIESNVVVGVIDSGILPESPSFDDAGLGPAPKQWKGVCNGGQNFTCNKKLIGARAYTEDARDSLGHGSHCASIAAGRKVDNTSFYGIANGSARGGVAYSRIAMYKVCDSWGCKGNNILAAFDDAIADGVDLISISVGGDPVDIYYDAVAIGSFHALEKGILTVQSGGNSGSKHGIIGSVAPWLFSIAASTTNRRIITKLVLGNGETVTGTSVNGFTMKNNTYPLVQIDLKLKESNERNEETFAGKIVLVEDPQFANYYLNNKASGVVARSTGNDDVSFVVPAPVVILSISDFDTVTSYLKNSTNPKGRILKSETVNDATAPIVASFSSRGPNSIAQDIFKPDITAPGVDIVAAFSPLAPITGFDFDKRRVNYNVLSGTSMSAPHVAGAVAYLKSRHPDWSPTAIKSALMTTSRPMNASKNPDGEFAYGAGHLNPTAALDPGLVYETTRDDYLNFLCKLNYTKEQIKLIANDDSFTCPQKNVGKLIKPNDVNYPAMTIKLDSSDATEQFSVEFQRTVTNVGVANSTYIAKVESSGKINVSVNPNSLSFESLKEQKSFTVTAVAEGLDAGALYSASLVWSDGIHSVRSPVVVYA